MRARAGKQWLLPFSPVNVCSGSMHRAGDRQPLTWNRPWGHGIWKEKQRKGSPGATRQPGRPRCPWGVRLQEGNARLWGERRAAGFSQASVDRDLAVPGPGLRGVGHAFPGSERCTPGGCGSGHGKQKTKVAAAGGCVRSRWRREVPGEAAGMRKGPWTLAKETQL